MTPAMLDDGDIQGVLAHIEGKVAHIGTQIRRAAALLVDPAGHHIGERSTVPAVTADDLLRHQEHWQAFIPTDATERTRLSRLLEDKFHFTLEALPPATVSDGSAYGLTWQELARGDVLCREGDPSDCLYILVNGRLQVHVRQADGQDVVVGEIGVGEVVGEMGLFADESRSASIVAIRDSELCRLSKAEFERMLDQSPRSLMGITRLIISRFRQTLHATHRGSTLRTLVLVPLGQVPVEQLARELAGVFSKWGSTQVIDRAMAAQFGLDAPEGKHDDGTLAAWLNEQEAACRYVIYVADATASPWTERCLRQADRLVFVADAASSPQLRPFERQLLAPSGDLMARTELVLLHSSRAVQPSGTGEWLRPRPHAAHHHVCLTESGDLSRLARRVTGRAVGLVLGGGGARSFSHIGVIRALHESGIPIDVIGGTSAGAIMAAQYACGWSPDEMLERSQSMVSSRRRVVDLTLPLVAFLSGRRLTSLLQTAFGDARIEDLWLKFFCLSANLNRTEPALHESGLLWHYLRAGTAIPGIFPPVLDHGDLLVDGSVLNALPIEHMAGICDGGLIVASDVAVQTPSAQEYEFGPHLSAWHIILNRMNPWRKTRINAPGVLMTMARAAELSAVRQRLAHLSSASLYIHPPLEKYGIFDVEAAEELMELGYRHALEGIARWPEREQFRETAG